MQSAFSRLFLGGILLKASVRDCGKFFIIPGTVLYIFLFIGKH